MNAEEIFTKHKELIRDELATVAKAKPDTITDDQIKAQITKGWVPHGDAVMCLSCGKKVADNMEEFGKMKKMNCKLCPMKFVA